MVSKDRTRSGELIGLHMCIKTVPSAAKQNQTMRKLFIFFSERKK